MSDPQEEAQRIVDEIINHCADTRLAECVRRWPGCEGGDYDPRCCRFPKSCSADIDLTRLPLMNALAASIKVDEAVKDGDPGSIDHAHMVMRQKLEEVRRVARGGNSR